MDADFFHRALAAQDTIDTLKAYLQNKFATSVDAAMNHGEC